MAESCRVHSRPISHTTTDMLHTLHTDLLNISRVEYLGRDSRSDLVNHLSSSSIQVRDMMFGSRVGFSGSADLMVQLLNLRNPR